MTRPRIGGVLDLAALAQLHRPKHSLAISDARLAVRRGFSALRALERDVTPADVLADAQRIAERLADAIRELDALEARVSRGAR